LPVFFFFHAAFVENHVYEGVQSISENFGLAAQGSVMKKYAFRLYLVNLMYLLGTKKMDHIGKIEAAISNFKHKKRIENEENLRAKVTEQV
jgi:hypothetical protein